MTTKTLRRRRFPATGNLEKRGTVPLGDTGLLNERQSRDELMGQVDKLLTETQLLSARFAAISDVAVAVNSSLRLDDILGVLVQKAAPGLGFDYCAVALLSEDANSFTLRPLVWPGERLPNPGQEEFGSSVGLPGFVMANSKPLAVQDLTANPLKVRPARVQLDLDPEMGANLVAAGLRSLMVLPMLAGRQVLGCLLFGKREPDYYTQDDMQLGYLFSMLLATALNNSRLFGMESRRVHQLQMLSEIGQTATSILDVSALLGKVPPLVQEYFGYDVAKIGLLENNEVLFASSTQYISGSPHPPDLRIKASADGIPLGIVGLAAFRGQLVHVPDVYEDERWADAISTLSGPHIRSVLVIPMTARDRVLGVLHFESEQVEAFQRADISILQSLANQLGVALDNARLYSQLNELFHGYIAPQVAETLLDNPENAQLGGQKRVVTVLFADLDNFTGLSERVPPELLLDLLNQCLGVATSAILQHGGTIDKYMGDAVMALFNAPEDQPDHAWRAVRAAITMQRELRKVTAGWEQKLAFSIGLNSGEAVVGNIGSSSLRNYTAIGDSVNLAKRIQEEAGPGQILMSQTTYESALMTATVGSGEEEVDNFVASRLGTKQVKGRSQPAVVYAVHPYTAPLVLPELQGR